jgi:hypothetical protein
MASYHSGSRSKLVEIHCNECSLIITGELPNKSLPQLDINRNVPATIIVSSPLGNDVRTKTITDYGELVLNHGNTMMPCFFEDGKYQLAVEMKERGVYDIYHGGIKLTENVY